MTNDNTVYCHRCRKYVVNALYRELCPPDEVCSCPEPDTESPFLKMLKNEEQKPRYIDSICEACAHSQLVEIPTEVINARGSEIPKEE